MTRSDPLECRAPPLQSKASSRRRVKAPPHLSRKHHDRATKLGRESCQMTPGHLPRDHRLKVHPKLSRKHHNHVKRWRAQRRILRHRRTHRHLLSPLSRLLLRGRRARARVLILTRLGRREHREPPTQHCKSKNQQVHQRLETAPLLDRKAQERHSRVARSHPARRQVPQVLQHTLLLNGLGLQVKGQVCVAQSELGLGSQGLGASESWHSPALSQCGLPSKLPPAPPPPLPLRFACLGSWTPPPEPSCQRARAKQGL